MKYDVHLPKVDGIPIPPYEPLSYPNPGPLTDKDMHRGFVLALARGVACLILYVIAVVLKH
jgi:hypothetical protein